MSENMEKAQAAIKLVSKMIGLIEIYESGILTGPVGVQYQLSAPQITQLKQEFASSRTECIALLNGISGE